MLTKRRNLLLLGTYLAGFTVLPVLVLPLAASMHGYSMEQIRGVGVIGAEVVASMNFGLYAILCLILLPLTFRIFKQDFKKIESWGRFFKQMGLGLLGTFGAVVVGNTIVMQIMGTMETSANQELAETLLVAMPVLMVISIVLLGPIVEEIIFRLVLMNHLNLKPIHNVIFSSLIFGAVHVLIGGWLHIIPYFLMGLVFGYTYVKQNNIWHVTILHILHNGLTVGLMFLAQYMIEMYYG